MNFNEILIACSSGKMPNVKSSIPIKYTTETIGTITTIKSNGKYRGVGVTFRGLDYEVWFIDSNDTDKRSKYIYQLSLI